jgi:hypothetical protein
MTTRGNGDTFKGLANGTFEVAAPQGHAFASDT